MRIAIVDDIKEERAVLYGWFSNQLSKRNIPGDFVEFESGEEFLAAAKERPFTVVFLDIYMNGAKLELKLQENLECQIQIVS